MCHRLFILFPEVNVALRLLSIPVMRALGRGYLNPIFDIPLTPSIRAVIEIFGLQLSWGSNVVGEPIYLACVARNPSRLQAKYGLHSGGSGCISRRGRETDGRLRVAGRGAIFGGLCG